MHKRINFAYRDEISTCGDHKMIQINEKQLAKMLSPDLKNINCVYFYLSSFCNQRRDEY